MKISASSLSLYSVDHAYALEKAVVASGIPSLQLMKRAARAAFDLILERYPACKLVTIYCGGGNNAGDGYVLAGLLAQRLVPVRVYYTVDPQTLTGDAARAYGFAQEGNVEMGALGSAPTEGIIVDALVGIGFKAPLRADTAAAIKQINGAKRPVIALDVPSGLDATTGAADDAVRATITLTFLGVKQGLVTGRGPAFSGDIVLNELGAPSEALASVATEVSRVTVADIDDVLLPREADAHKGHFGHVMVIGGDSGFGGAALMAAESAARSGAGRVSVATRPEHVAAILARRPEVMAVGVVSGQELEPLLARPTVLVVGPGLGQTPWSEQMLQQAAKTQLPLVLDADALTLLAEGRVIPHQQRGNWVLTPHPAEAARLLGVTTADIQADRYAAVRAIAKKYHAQVILKGAGSLIAGPEGDIAVITDGNPGMATGGMGDVLSGIIGALLAQQVSPFDAAKVAALVHAAAADVAAHDKSERSLLATDLIPYLGEWL
jgi:hydroxyethylthiazole kinase-like uncharacterized protein yjeF